jgi:hypothetical protein
MTIVPGVPETISRADYLRLVRSVGFETDELASLRFAYNGIYAVVYALDSDGRRFLDKTSGEPAVHTIFVRVVDPPPSFEGCAE